MRGARLRRLALGLVSLGVAAGCRTLSSPPPLLAGGLVSSSPLSPDQDRAAQTHALYSLGIHHELADEYDLAYEAYRQAAALDPGNERLVLRVASTLALQRKTKDALRTVEDFLERRPDSESALLWLANFYGTTGNDARVVDLFRQITRQFPEKPLAWIQLSKALARSGDTNAVAALLQEGIAKAKPPTALRQEQVRLHLVDMQAARDSAAQDRARRKAIAGLRQIAEEIPGDLDTLYLLGDLLVKDGRLENAIRVYEKIERLQPADQMVKERLARTFLAMDDQPKAIAVLEEMARKRSGPSNAHYYLGELYLQSGDAEKAAAHFRTAAEHSPGDPDPWLKLAALQAEQDPERAVATLVDALGQLPGHPKLLEVFALLRLQQKRYAESAELMRQVYESVGAKDPDTGPSQLFFYNYAVVCTHLRRTADAANWLGRAIEQEPDFLELYMQRTMTGTGTFRKNAMGVLRALARQPGTERADVHAHLATLYLSQEKADRAVREFETAVEIVRRNPLQAVVLRPKFYFWFGVALDQARQTDRAVEMFETCLELDSEYADALNYLAYLWAVRGVRLDEALRHIQTALSLDPENAAYLDTLGWVYFQAGRYADALAPLEQADRLRPDDPEIRGHLEQTRQKLAP